MISAFYYLMIVKKMYFDEPAPAYAETKEPVGSALILISALLVSPLGYLTIQPLGQAATNAAQALF